MIARPRQSNLVRTAIFAILIGLALVGAGFIVSPLFEAKRQVLLPNKPDAQIAVRIKPDKIALIDGQALLDELHKGGLVIFMRHFHSDHREFHEDPVKQDHLTMTLEDFKNTGDKQRHLSEYGRQRAQLTRDAIAKFQIPIGKVISSPYIRAVEGATILTGREPDLITKDLLHRGGEYSEAMMVEKILPYLTTPVEATSNTILMSHRPPMDGIHHIEEGQMFVFRPTGSGEFEMIAGIHDTDWVESQVSIEFLGKRYAQFTSSASDENVGKSK